MSEYYVVQGNYGQGWEDVTASTSREEILRDLYDYDSNEPYNPHRIVTRKDENNEH